jgi:RecJ OB domain
MGMRRAALVVSDRAKAQFGVRRTAPRMHSDPFFTLASPGAARGLLQDFKALAPSAGNPEPRFALAGVKPEQSMVLSGGHVRRDLVDPAGRSLKAVAWRAGDSNLGRRLMAGGGSPHVAGVLKVDAWNGRDGVQLEIEDVADPRQATPGWASALKDEGLPDVDGQRISRSAGGRREFALRRHLERC